MDLDIKRIGVGNVNVPGIDDGVIVIPEPVFTFDSTEIFFDSTTDKFDEENG